MMGKEVLIIKMKDKNCKEILDIKILLLEFMKVHVMFHQK
jgi:hypothetical protein